MNVYFSRLGLILTIISNICSCTTSMEREPPVTPSPVLNEFVGSAPFQYLNLDEAEVLEIELMEEDIIFDVNQEGNSGEPLLGQITDFTCIENVFYVYDMNNGSIFMIDKDGGVMGPLTRSGRGPGEHLGVGKLMSNTHYIYASDRNNGRINKYSNDMITAGVLDGFRSMLVDLNDEKILTENSNSIGFSPPNPDQEIIVLSSIGSLSDTLATILPRIIPSGYQPEVYNNPRFSINSQNDIAATYLPLPWIFLFDSEYNFKQTLILEYSVFDEMNIPAMDFFRPQGNEGFGGTMPISQFKIMDNGDLFISIQKELIHLSINVDQTYRVVRRNRFKINDQDTYLWVADLCQSEDDNKLYAGNWEFLFQFVLTE